jgi:hypothetical protein
VGEAKRTIHEEMRAWCRMLSQIYADAADLGYSPSAAIRRIVEEHNLREDMVRRSTDPDDRQQKEAACATRSD